MQTFVNLLSHDMTLDTQPQPKARVVIIPMVIIQSTHMPMAYLAFHIIRSLPLVNLDITILICMYAVTRPSKNMVMYLIRVSTPPVVFHSFNLLWMHLSLPLKHPFIQILSLLRVFFPPLPCSFCWCKCYVIPPIISITYLISSVKFYICYILVELGLYNLLLLKKEEMFQ